MIDGIDLDKLKDTKGLSMLHLAVLNGSKGKVPYLLRKASKIMPAEALRYE